MKDSERNFCFRAKSYTHTLSTFQFFCKKSPSCLQKPVSQFRQCPSHFRSVNYELLGFLKKYKQRGKKTFTDTVIELFLPLTVFLKILLLAVFNFQSYISNVKFAIDFDIH